MATRKKALERGWPGPGGEARVPGECGDELVRLGVNPHDEQPFDLTVAEIA